MTSPAAQAAPPPIATPQPAPARRLMSLDALRGFDLFWIIGADALVYALNRMTQTPVTRFCADQLEHVDWVGFHFYDLIFPLFIFIAGASLAFSLSRTLEEGGLVAALPRVIRRGLLLYCLGILYYGGLSHTWPGIRMTGVLNRIALAYTAAGILFCLFKTRTLAVATITLLLGYWALMAWTPIRDIQLTKESLSALASRAGDAQAATFISSPGNPSAQKEGPAWAAAEKLFYATRNRVTGKYDKGYNLSDHIDFQYLPGRRYDNYFDPEGILSTLPAIATCLLGVFAGLLVRNPSLSDFRKLRTLVVGGIVLVAIGWLWHIQFPVIKKIWTSSYVLVAGGYSALLLAAFYYVVDVRKVQRWCAPFVWMGMNPITIYIASGLLGDELAGRFAGGDLRIYLDTHVVPGAGELLMAIVGLGLAFVLARFLYKRKIFLRV